MAATYTKPSKINEWADTGTVVEPSEAKKDSGWVAPELPPDTFFNWWMNIAGQWTKWVDERLDDDTADRFVIRNPDTAGDVLNIGSTGGFDAIRFFADADLYFTKDGAGVRLNYDLNDDLVYSQALNRLDLNIASDLVTRSDSNGLIVKRGLVAGTDTLTPDTVKVLQFGNLAAPSVDGDFWLGWVGTDKPKIVLSDANGVFMDSFSGDFRIFHGGTAALQGAAGTNDMTFFGDVEMDGGVNLNNPLGVLPTAGYVKINGDNFRLQGFHPAAGGAVHWDFANGDKTEWNDVTNELEWYVAGTLQMGLLANALVDETAANTMDIGTITGVALGKFFNRVVAREFVPADALAFSTSPGNPGFPANRVRAQTCPFMVAAMDSNGVTPVNLIHNVASTLRLSAGQYRLTPHVVSNWGRLNVLVTIHLDSLTDVVAHAANVGGDVKTYTQQGLSTTDHDHNVLVFDGGWIV